MAGGNGVRSLILCESLLLLEKLTYNPLSDVNFICEQGDLSSGFHTVCSKKQDHNVKRGVSRNGFLRMGSALAL